VDGLTPLHLLIRRRFQYHVLNRLNPSFGGCRGGGGGDGDDDFMEILELFVSQCPRSVLVEDGRGEPPIVYAIKARQYSPLLAKFERDDADAVAVVIAEERILEILRVMLRHCPDAATAVFASGGSSGDDDYRHRHHPTPLHAALSHGRDDRVVELLLEAGSAGLSDSSPSNTEKVGLVANRRGEVPLHLCTMSKQRECDRQSSRILGMIAKAAPGAVSRRDESGLTPLHWLWIRHAENMLAHAMGGDGGDWPDSDDHRGGRRHNETGARLCGSKRPIVQRVNQPLPGDLIETFQGIPTATHGHWSCPSSSSELAERTLASLQREQDDSMVSSSSWLDVESSLFWNNTVSLLDAALVSSTTVGEVNLDRCIVPRGDSMLVHAAFASPSCPPEMCWIAARLFPNEMSLLDEHGRFPVHYAAARPWDTGDWSGCGASTRPSSGDQDDHAPILEMESIRVLETAISLSPAAAFAVADIDNRCVLHYAVETFVRACSHATASPAGARSTVRRMLDTTRTLIGRSPETLQQRDGASMLFPFMQASAVATEEKEQLPDQMTDEIPLTITYDLLRSNPASLTSVFEA